MISFADMMIPMSTLTVHTADTCTAGAEAKESTWRTQKHNSELPRMQGLAGNMLNPAPHKFVPSAPRSRHTMDSFPCMHVSGLVGVLSDSSWHAGIVQCSIRATHRFRSDTDYRARTWHDFRAARNAWRPAPCTLHCVCPVLRSLHFKSDQCRRAVRGGPFCMG